jgi:HSP20 family protein
MNELESLPHSPGRLFSDSRINWPGDYERAVQRVPLVDISQDDKEYLIRAELPEVKKEDVKIAMDYGGTLTITGDREFEVNSRKNHHVERAYGCFLYSFLFPDNASPTKVSAKFEDGVLTVHLAKDLESQNPQFEIEVS